MKVKIYQIDIERDTKRVKFSSFNQILHPIDAEIYNTVFDGELDTHELEGVFIILNTMRVQGFMGHSLSVSDVVEVVEDINVPKGFYYVDQFGFKQIHFEPEKAKAI